jgi:hypothetical protein
MQLWLGSEKRIVATHTPSQPSNVRAWRKT